MPLDISFQPMRVLIDGHDGDGRLILVNDHLAAVILRLDGQSHAPEHKGLRTWVCERSRTLETRTQREPWCPDACSRDLCPRAQTVVRLAEEERHGGIVPLALWESRRSARNSASAMPGAADGPEGAMIPCRDGIPSGASIILSAAVIFSILKHGPTAVDTPWGLLVALAAALGLHVLGLCSAMSLGARRHDDE
jgi:hypothetical protein